MVENKSKTWRFQGMVFPSIVFVTVFVVHLLWAVIFPEQDPAQSGWSALPEESSRFQRYLEAQAYWLGYAYSLSIAFAIVAFRHYLRVRNSTSKSLAFGGIGFAGILTVTGCFIIGCCGSPMLLVWINLFGVSFVPLAKPVLAAFTTLFVAAAWLWVRQKSQDQLRISTFATDIDRTFEKIP